MNNSKIIFTNIIKGIFRKKVSLSSRFETLSWLQQKKIKHLDDYSDKVVSLSEKMIYYKHPYEFLHTYEDIFVKEIYSFHSDKQAPFILDCGANIGISILYFKSIFPDAIIVAFEADKNNFEILKKNISRNNLINVELLNEAVWIHNDGVYFDAVGKEDGHISTNGEIGQELTKSKRLATVLENAAHIDFLKMDIEGAEYEVLKDCAINLHKIENMFIEYHGKIGETNKLRDILSLIEENGFSVYIKNAADSLSHPYIDRNTNGLYDVQLNLFCYKEK